LAKRIVKKYTGPMNRTAAPARGRPEAEPAASDERSKLGLIPSVKAEDVPAVVKRERSFGIFGPRETVTAVTLQFRTLVQLGIRKRRGLLKRRFETVYAYLDGTTGKEVSIGRGLEVAKGFEKLLGLTTLQVEVLRLVEPDSDTSALDIASEIGESKPTVSRVLSFLNDRRLVRSIEVRNRKLFRRLTDLPGEPSTVAPLELDLVDPEKGSILAPKIREADVRDAVKGLWEGADVESFEPFLYPVFKVELVVKRKHRQVLIDGRSGKELAF